MSSGITHRPLNSTLSLGPLDPQGLGSPTTTTTTTRIIIRYSFFLIFGFWQGDPKLRKGKRVLL